MSSENNLKICDSREKREEYDLVSTLYHALESITVYDRYISDAQKAEDRELIIFFLELREASHHTAAKAKKLLKYRI